MVQQLVMKYPFTIDILYTIEIIETSIEYLIQIYLTHLKGYKILNSTSDTSNTNQKSNNFNQKKFKKMSNTSNTINGGGSLVASLLSPLLGEYDTPLTNVQVGKDLSLQAAKDLESAYASLALDTPPEIQDLQATLTSYEELKTRAALEKSILQDLLLYASVGSLSIHDLQKEFEAQLALKLPQKLNELKASNYASVTEMQELRRSLFEIRHPGQMMDPDHGEDDEEVLITTQKESLKCPITVITSLSLFL
jgi:hypothetical protein